MGKIVSHFSGENLCIDDIEQLFGAPVWVTAEKPIVYSTVGIISKEKFWAIYKTKIWKSRIMWDEL